MRNSKELRSISTLLPSEDADSAQRTTRQRLESILKPMPADDETSGTMHKTVPEGEPHAPEPITRSRPVVPDEGHSQYRIRRGRFRKTVTFFTLLFFRLLWWEAFVRRFTGEKFVARGRSERWRKYARRFRKMAIEMGGVMIKLGQFVSTRVDVLPPEITEELAGLQDQVPIVGFDYIKSTIERELGPLNEHFLWFNSEPIAAASFGQVHRAQLPNGDRVVVKVQRPNITDIVQTDLTALRFVAHLAMRYKPIRRRADVPALLDEFSRVLWEELDYRQEADNALTFNSMFAEDLGIYVPSVYLQLSTHYVLTLEDVTSIKINDYAALDRAGINRKEIAQRLINCYLRQIFDYRFFHADPHPGNLFVYPLPDKYQTQDNLEYNRREFYLIFIDFGMTGRLTEQISVGLRETLIALLTQDAKAMVSSYHKLGILMPSADMARLEAATRAVFDKVWGLNMDEMRNLPFEEVTSVALEFSDLLLSMPFQMPQDFIYLSRAVSILSGMATGLDPDFDPWREMQPFAQRILNENSSSQRSMSLFGSGASGVFTQAALKAIRDFFTRAYRLPALADTVLDRADRGELVVQVKAGSELHQQVTRIENALNQLSIGLVFTAVIIVSTLLYLNGDRGISIVGYFFSALLFLMILARGRS